MSQRTRGWILLALAVLVAVGFLWIRQRQGNSAEQAAGQANEVVSELESVFSATSGRPTPGAVAAELFDPEQVTVAWPDVTGVDRYGYTADDAIGDKAATAKAKVELVYFGQNRASGWCFKVTYGQSGPATVDKRSCPDGPGPVDAPG